MPIYGLPFFIYLRRWKGVLFRDGVLSWYLYLICGDLCFLAGTLKYLRPCIFVIMAYKCKYDLLPCIFFCQMNIVWDWARNIMYDVTYVAGHRLILPICFTRFGLGSANAATSRVAELGKMTFLHITWKCQIRVTSCQVTWSQKMNIVMTNLDDLYSPVQGCDLFRFLSNFQNVLSSPSDLTHTTVFMNVAQLRSARGHHLKYPVSCVCSLLHYNTMYEYISEFHNIICCTYPRASNEVKTRSDHVYITPSPWLSPERSAVEKRDRRRSKALNMNFLMHELFKAFQNFDL